MIMKELRRPITPSLLLMSVVSVIAPDYAYGEMPKIMIPTDNGSMFVEITIDKGDASDNTFTIDAPQQVKIDTVFLNPGAFEPLTHVNYEYHITDETGSMLVHKTALHLHDGMDTQSVTFSETGSFTLTIVVKGLGLSEPYDTSRSGIVSAMITVVPEFPFSVIAITAALVSIAVVATRFKNSLKL